MTGRSARPYDPARDHALMVELARRLRAAGCFARCDQLYARRLALLVPLFAAGFTALLVVPRGPAWALAALATGFVSVQLGIVSHDASRARLFRLEHIRQRRACAAIEQSRQSPLPLRGRALGDLHHFIQHSVV